MPLAHTRGRRWLSLGLLLALGWAAAADEGVPVPREAHSPGVLARETANSYWVAPRPSFLDSIKEAGCEPCCGGPDEDLRCPFEFYVRTGAAKVLNQGKLDDILQTGYVLEAGVKNFWPDSRGSGTWTGELGLDYIFNNADSLNDGVLRRNQFTLRELHRLFGHVAAGYEWNWDPGDQGGHHWLLAIDFGGRLGHAHAKFEGINAFRGTDIPYGVFLGFNAGCVVPCDKFDVVLGGRIEWSHDWIDIFAAMDRDLDQIKFLLSIGCRR